MHFLPTLEANKTHQSVRRNFFLIIFILFNLISIKKDTLSLKKFSKKSKYSTSKSEFYSKIQLFLISYILAQNCPKIKIDIYSDSSHCKLSFDIHHYVLTPNLHSQNTIFLHFFEFSLSDTFHDIKMTSYRNHLYMSLFPCVQ